MDPLFPYPFSLILHSAFCTLHSLPSSLVPFPLSPFPFPFSLNKKSPREEGIFYLRLSLFSFFNKDNNYGCDDGKENNSADDRKN